MMDKRKLKLFIIVIILAVVLCLSYLLIKSRAIYKRNKDATEFVIKGELPKDFPEDFKP